MKLMHLSDLHLGKRLHECPLLEDQAYILAQILRIAEAERPDAVLIAGDVYDKPVPPAEAVRLCDGFLTDLAALGCTVLLTSGNHDSAERVGFGAQLLQKSGVYVSPPYDAGVRPVTLRDEAGEVDFWLLPFLKPALVRHAWAGGETAGAGESTESAAPRAGAEPAGSAKMPPAREPAACAEEAAARGEPAGPAAPSAGAEAAQGATTTPAEESAAEKPPAPTVGQSAAAAPDLSSYDAAVRYAVARLPLRPGVRCVLVAHQFVTGAARCDSEEVTVGGVDNVDAAAFDAFNYVALGHIHSAQSVGRPAVRYCGTPLKYSFSEAGQQKSVTLVTLGADGVPVITTRPLVPKREVREVRGGYLELTDPAVYRGTAEEDYLHITLTHQEEIPEAMGRLRSVYPNLLRLDYDNRRTREKRQVDGAARPEQKTPLELFKELYELQNNQPMTDLQADFCETLIRQVWEEVPPCGR